MGASPIFFMCPKRRLDKWKYAEFPGAEPEHDIVRTGRTKPNSSNRRGSRTLPEVHEFKCSCGHVGWSKHVGVLNKPVDIDGLIEAKGYDS
jgi:hypothetical protein